MNGLKVQLSKMSRDLVDLECTNGELKEEVETLEVTCSCSYSHIHIMLDIHTYIHTYICTYVYIPKILTFAALLRAWLSHT